MKLRILLSFLVFAVVSTACGKRIETVVGQKGDAGQDGTNGTGCSADEVSPSAEFPAGGVLIDCSGDMTFVRNGADSTPVTTVRLCPGTTTYPSKFVEIAFKISNRLFATYSANGGFMTELVPGNYSSNAIGSSCNFTVNADMSISH